jgi:hypothetical protein
LGSIVIEAGIRIQEIERLITHRFPKHSMYFGGVQATLWHPQLGFLVYQRRLIPVALVALLVVVVDTKLHSEILQK